MTNLKLRYYQARRMVPSQHVDMDALNAKAPPGGPPAIGVSERVLFTPDEAVYLCEGQASTWFETLDYAIEFAPGVGYDDMPEAVAYYWQEVEVDLRTYDDERGWYIHRSEVLRSREEPFEFQDWLYIVVFQGEYPDEDEDGERALDAAREDAQGNHRV